jgi:hypothetical protein
MDTTLSCRIRGEDRMSESQRYKSCEGVSWIELVHHRVQLPSYIRQWQVPSKACCFLDSLLKNLRLSQRWLSKSYVFWDLTPCSPFKVNWRFGETCLHLLGQKRSQTRNQREAGSKQKCISWFRMILRINSKIPSPLNSIDRCGFQIEM